MRTWFTRWSTTQKKTNAGGGQIVIRNVRYDHLDGGLVVKGDRLEGFALAGADRKWRWADARIDSNEVLVSCPLVREPKYLRYDYVDVPKYCLWSKAGLPAVPFDTRLGP